MNVTLLLILLFTLLVLFCISLVWLFIQIYLYKVGMEFVVVRDKDRTPFAVKKMTENSMVLVSEMDISNDGQQCAIIMDALLRPQLPFEQYDGIEAWGRVELANAPREDNYFEAVLIQKKSRIRVRMELTLRARKGMSMQEALADMVDFGVDFIYQQAGRRPYRYSKVRMEVTAQQLRALAGGSAAQEDVAAVDEAEKKEVLSDEKE